MIATTYNDLKEKSPSMEKKSLETLFVVSIMRRQ